MTAVDQVQLGLLIAGFSSWVSAASFSNQQTRAGLLGLTFGIVGVLTGIVLLGSGLARSAFG